jgi:hypothetical protein
MTKRQIIEEPCEVKVSRTVLKTSGTGDSLAEFNMKRNLHLLRRSTGTSLQALARTAPSKAGTLGVSRYPLPAVGYD